MGGWYISFAQQTYPYPVSGATMIPQMTVVTDLARSEDLLDCFILF